MTPIPPGDAHLSSAALHLLLAQHPELVELPVVWQIDEDATIRPFLRVGHPDCVKAVQLLAAGLELDVDRFLYTADGGVPMQSLRLEGRWGGASWLFVCYTLAEDPAEVRS